MSLEFVKNISNAMVYNSTIEHLFMNESEIDNAGVTYICESLSKNNSLKTLSLSGNYFRSKGFDSISKLLENTKTLKSLNISSNYPRGSIKKFFESIAQNQSLTELYMSDVELKSHPNGFKWFYQAIKDKPLKVLDTSNNDFSETSLMYICDLIKFNPYLENLILKSLNFKNLFMIRWLLE
jgi:Ran GTPase-activating protein (RanGAP) involved in mRNA processing and transport